MSEVALRPGETCTRPLKLLTLHGATCGKLAVAAVELVIEGQVVRIALCQDCYLPAFWATLHSKPG